MSNELLGRVQVDYATLTVSSVAVGLASASPSLTAGSSVRRAFISVEDDDVRWRADGTNPTDSEGHLVEVGDYLSFMDRNYDDLLTKIRFIRVTADAKLKISYFN
jgi:hypothetical protein